MKTTLVLCSISDRRHYRHPDNGAHFLFDHEGVLSLDHVNAFFEANRHIPGWDQIRARRKLYTLKNERKFWRWVDRRNPRTATPANYLGQLKVTA